MLLTLALAAESFIFIFRIHQTKPKLQNTAPGESVQVGLCVQVRHHCGLEMTEQNLYSGKMFQLTYIHLHYYIMRTEL